MVTTEEVWEFFQNKEQRTKEHLDSLFKKATTDAQKIFQHIIQNYDPLRVIQWG